MTPTDAPPQAPSAAAQDLYREASLWLAISLGSSLFCASLCLGIGGAVFCWLAMQSAQHGLLADADLKLRWGKILTLVGSTLGVLSTTLWLVFR